MLPSHMNLEKSWDNSGIEIIKLNLKTIPKINIDFKFIFCLRKYN